MKQIKLMITVISFLGVAGCMSAQMVSSPKSGSAYAPVNERARGGVVKYLNDGADFVRNQRRDDAYKQMHDACNGPYKIDAEGSSAEGGGVINTGGTSFWTQSNYWYIKFSCA